MRGCSFHYAPPADSIEVNRKHQKPFQQVLQEHGYSHVKGTTRTTDACYREAREKVARRKAQGVICVEMECAGMQAAADFRGADFFEFFYAGDNLDQPVWDSRSLAGHARLDDKGKIALLAFELGVKIMEREK